MTDPLHMQGPRSNFADSASDASFSARTEDASVPTPHDPFGDAPRPLRPTTGGARATGPVGRAERSTPDEAVDDPVVEATDGATQRAAPDDRELAASARAPRVTVACSDASFADRLVERIGRRPDGARVETVPASTDPGAETDVWIVEVRTAADAERVGALTAQRPDLRVVALDRRADASARVALLESGADHALEGGAGTDEVAACAEVHLRRFGRGRASNDARANAAGGDASSAGATSGAAASSEAGTGAAGGRGTRPARIEVEDGLVVDLGRMQIERGATRIDLTPLEAGILGHVIRNDDRVVAREEILEAVWGARESRACARTVDVHVVALRRKLHDGSGSQRLLRTVRGLGYRWCG